MSLINFTDIDFTNKSMYKENVVIEFHGYSIEIVPYLSMQDKYNLIMQTISKSDEVDLYNDFKTKFYFDLHLVLSYSNIVFSEADTQDEVKLYDTLKKSGLMDKIIDAIPAEEKEELWNNILSTQKNMMSYRRSFGSLLTLVLQKAPGIINQLQEVLSSLDEKQIYALQQIFAQLTGNKNSSEE